MTENRGLFFTALCLSCLFILSLAQPAEARRRPENNAANPRYAMIIMDAQSGRVLEEQNADRALPPASLTKIMTLFLVFDALERHQITMNSYLKITPNAMSQAPSKIGLKLNDKMTIEQAILVLVTRSANDVAMALAETIGGSAGRFTDMMTARARSLGMKNSAFYNPSGLPDPGQKSSARDMAILARAHMQYFPQYYHYFNTIRTNYHGQNVETHNNLMRRYPGMDGLKTGYTYASGFNLVSSAVRNNRRVIVAVFGGKSAAARDNHVADLMNRGLDTLTGNKMATQMAEAQQASIQAVAAPAPTQMATQAQKTAKAKTPAAAKIASRKQQQAAIAVTPAAGSPTADRKAWQPDGGIAKPLQIATATPAAYQPKPAASKNWGVQVGAFNNSTQSQQTLAAIQTRLRGSLSDVGQAVVIPTRTAQGVVYRARIVNLTAQDASKACQVVADCMAFTTR